MYLSQRTIPGLAHFSYFVGDETSRLAAVIDPARAVDEYMQLAERHGFKIIYILETHVHADFVSGARELKAALSNQAEIIVSGLGGKGWIPSYADRVVKDGENIKVGNLNVTVIATPGHTPEHVAYLLDNTILFTGDFLFYGDVGRPDLLGEKDREALASSLWHSVFYVLKRLDDSLEILPAHGAGSLCGKAIAKKSSSTLGEEREMNLALKYLPEKEWVENLMHEMPDAPPYFSRMKKINVEGPQILGKNKPGNRELSLQEIPKEAFLLDLRSQKAFCEGHIPGAVSLPFSPNLVYWAGWLVPDDRPIVLVLEKAEDLDKCRMPLFLIGLDQILGYTLEKGSERLELITSDELRKNKGAYVVDVRTLPEYREGHFEGAHHIPLGELPKRLSTVPKDRDIVVMCRAGYRSHVGASLLLKGGFKAKSLEGGLLS